MSREFESIQDDRIQQGCNSITIKVKHKLTGDKYIQKKIVCNNLDKMRDCLSEIMGINMVVDPHIACLYKYYLQGNNFYLYTPYYKGSTLQNLIDNRKKDKKKMTQSHVIKYTAQLLSAVQVLHTAGIIHADLKPDNIFIEKVDNHNQIRIGDFGISKILENKRGETNNMFFHPHCAAPELWDQKEFTQKCDVFSLGLIFYELVTLEKLITMSTKDEVQSFLQKNGIPTLEKEYGIVQELLNNMLQYDPQKRMTIQQLIELLCKKCPELQLSLFQNKATYIQQPYVYYSKKIICHICQRKDIKYIAGIHGELIRELYKTCLNVQTPPLKAHNAYSLINSLISMNDQKFESVFGRLEKIKLNRIINLLCGSKCESIRELQWAITIASRTEISPIVIDEQIIQDFDQLEKDDWKRLFYNLGSRAQFVESDNEIFILHNIDIDNLIFNNQNIKLQEQFQDINNRSFEAIICSHSIEDINNIQEMKLKSLSYCYLGDNALDLQLAWPQDLLSLSLKNVNFNNLHECSNLQCLYSQNNSLSVDDLDQLKWLLILVSINDTWKTDRSQETVLTVALTKLQYLEVLHLDRCKDELTQNAQEQLKKQGQKSCPEVKVSLLDKSGYISHFRYVYARVSKEIKVIFNAKNIAQLRLCSLRVFSIQKYEFDYNNAVESMITFVGAKEDLQYLNTELSVPLNF